MPSLCSVRSPVTMRRFARLWSGTIAGFTGSQLAVVWVGRDDNQQTGLWGATGALQAWIALFRKLPSAPFVLPQDGLETVWVDMQSAQRTQAQCTNARELPFIAGTAPSGTEHCAWQEIKSLFGDGH